MIIIHQFIIRFLDILFSILGIFILFPLSLFIVIWIILDSPGGIFYRQERIGAGGVFFSLIKFRTMVSGADKSGLLTIGGNDQRITKSGLFLRKFKLDELPQLINVLFGQMSIVGPRPEVKLYVDLYTEEQRKVLSVKPGITDWASIHFSNENELLSKVDHPQQFYLDIILPSKIELNLRYIEKPTVGHYIRIIFVTIKKIFT
jgi:lipopolysaccharide/colanic/teichoic acid biosynthesis glycosyltransferase